jgi:hypothetical protein
MPLMYRITLTTPHFFPCFRRKTPPTGRASSPPQIRSPTVALPRPEIRRHRLGRTPSPPTELDLATDGQAEPQLHRTLLLRRFKHYSSTGRIKTPDFLQHLLQTLPGPILFNVCYKRCPESKHPII